MRKKRLIIEGATYHVTARTNGKIPNFSQKLDQKRIYLMIQKAKEKYNFKLHNFCIMPNHIHLLLTPATGTSLSRIMQWIKTHSAKVINYANRTCDHLWGDRFFSRPIKDDKDYIDVFNYIDQNPVKAGYVENPKDWVYSGAYYFDCDIIDK